MANITKKVTVKSSNSSCNEKANSTPLVATNASDDKELIRCVTTNLKNLINMQKINQKQLSAKTGYCEAAVCKYCNGKMLPPIDFFFKLQQLYDISIDDFISRTILEPAPDPDPYRELREAEELELGRKYCGNFLVYYLDTSNYKGRDYNSPAESLVYGVVSIREVKTIDKPEFETVAILGLENREDAARIKDKLDSLDSFEETTTFINADKTSHNIYKGDFEFGAKHAYITLKHGNIDRALIVLYRVETNKDEFNGGLGVINSGSKGREKMPTAQFIAFSRYPLSLSAEEIHHELLLTYPTFKADDEIKELITMFKHTFLTESRENSLFTDYQKELMLKACIEDSMKKIIARNMDRYAKISERDDSAWYHLLKHEEKKRQHKLESDSEQY